MGRNDNFHFFKLYFLCCATIIWWIKMYIRQDIERSRIRLTTVDVSAGQISYFLVTMVTSYFYKLDKLLGPKGLRMMPPPGLQIYIRPRVTLTFDLLTPVVDRLMPLSLGPLGIKIVLFVFNGRTNERTDRQSENIMPPSARLAWRRHKNKILLISSRLLR